ncbi:MAG: toll/interleukin-1 receptor domain-containing protein [Chloroflexi bacterium]|nr:toll/interleukin-1 receptor domain-containing protein [Chloroflexota bacterium]
MRLVNDLKQNGLRTWRDKENIKRGETWDDAIKRGIEA